MMYFLNRGLIMEQVIAEAIREYFHAMSVEKMYPNYELNITNEHPWARILMNRNSDAAGLFPAIIVTSESDIHAPHNGHPLPEVEKLILEPADLDHLVEHGYTIHSEVVERLRMAFEGRENLYGHTFIIRRLERISIEIWAENITVKNSLYEDVLLFVLGALSEYLEEYRKKYGLIFFDDTVDGQRSGTFTNTYGIGLAGANITFNIDYMIEQSYINTDIIKINEPVTVKVKHGNKE
jgi:hypothetical protein